jgi:hypothetical protein
MIHLGELNPKMTVAVLVVTALVMVVAHKWTADRRRRRKFAEKS